MRAVRAGLSAPRRGYASKPFPESAEIVIIGGGCVGTAVSYMLSKHGVKDVVLVEREPALCSATSSWAAGLCGQVRASKDRVKLAQKSVATFQELQRLSDEANGEIPGPSWKEVGSLRLAHTDARVEEFKRMKRVADEAGLEVDLIGAKEAEKYWPGIQLEKTGVKAAIWCPTDGYLMPADLAAAYRHHAKAAGVRFVTKARVTGIDSEGGKRIRAVETTAGTIKCNYVINAAGTHAGIIAEMAGAPRLPIIPVRHSYFLSTPVEGVHPNLPVLRISDKVSYIRADCNTLLIGGFEPNGYSCSPEDFPMEIAPESGEPDYGCLEMFSEVAQELFPKYSDATLRAVCQGWPTFTPDGRFMVGELPTVKGLVFASACCAHGVSGSPGIGAHVVESMFTPESEQSEYVRSLSPARFLDTDWTDPKNWESAKRAGVDIIKGYYANISS